MLMASAEGGGCSALSGGLPRSQRGSPGSFSPPSVLPGSMQARDPSCGSLMTSCFQHQRPPLQRRVAGRPKVPHAMRRGSEAGSAGHGEREGSRKRKKKPRIIRGMRAPPRRRVPSPPRACEGECVVGYWEVRGTRPRLAYPRREREDADSLAMSTDALMKTHQIESVASIPIQILIWFPPSLRHTFRPQEDAYPPVPLF
jgi:hypothetical protein